jgi:Glucosidase II beta subunit-like protein
MIGVDDSEYDFMILDPEHPYGSPYGGFSRASARRLSSLPLKLPNVPENVEEFKPFYMKVVDAFGRPFSCRAYHENDLDPSTLGDGMFEPPVFRSSNAKEEEESSGASGDEKSTSPPEVDNMFLRNKATKNLSILKGMCAQYHQGWWSYEWCFEDKVSQFHVNIENAGGKNEVITVEDMTNLGEFKGISSTKISNPFSTSLQDSEVQSKNEMTVEFEKREFFVEGDICAATGQPRKSEAVLLCCPSATKSRKKSIVFQDGKRMETDLVYLKGIVEWETCSYTVTICTPLLCHEQLLDEEHSGLDVTKAIDAARQKEIESLQNRAVSEVIGSVFRLDTAMNCVVYRDGGWYVPLTLGI